jgi:hypothetical protein
MSGSCKRETVADQEKLITTSIMAAKIEEEQLKVILYCLCSDGDARRRRAFINITMKRTPPTRLNISVTHNNYCRRSRSTRPYTCNIIAAAAL